jgi:hypothetical protein
MHLRSPGQVGPVRFVPSPMLRGGEPAGVRGLDPLSGADRRWGLSPRPEDDGIVRLLASLTPAEEGVNCASVCVDQSEDREDNLLVFARWTRLIAPISLGLAGLLLLVVSTPPWFNALWGEEYGVSWSGIALAVPQLMLAALMLRGSGVATVLGVAIAAALLLLNLLLLLLANGSPAGTEVFATMSALYALVIAAALVDGWSDRFSESGG